MLQIKPVFSQEQIHWTLLNLNTKGIRLSMPFVFNK